MIECASIMASIEWCDSCYLRHQHVNVSGFTADYWASIDPFPTGIRTITSGINLQSVARSRPNTTSPSNPSLLQCSLLIYPTVELKNPNERERERERKRNAVLPPPALINRVSIARCGRHGFIHWPLINDIHRSFLASLQSRRRNSWPVLPCGAIFLLWTEGNGAVNRLQWRFHIINAFLWHFYDSIYIYTSRYIFTLIWKKKKKEKKCG